MFDIGFISDAILLAWIGLVSLLSTNVKKKKILVLGQEEERNSLLFSIVVFLPVFWVVCLGEPRADGWAYISSFENITYSLADVITNWWNYSKGPGFLFIEVLIKQMFGNNVMLFRILIGLIQSIPIVLVYRRYSVNYVFSIFLFVTSGFYSAWMMNGIRQFLAACILFATVPLLIKKRFFLVMLIGLGAVQIHKSAIIMIPIVLLVHFKPWKIHTILMIVGFAVVLYFYIYNSDWLNEEAIHTMKGSNPIRIAISAIPVIIAFIGRKKIEECGNTIINISINMSMVTVAMYVVASLTSGLMAGRLPGFTAMYNFLLIPYLTKELFNEKISNNLKAVIILFYSLYFLIGLAFGIT